MRKSSKHARKSPKHVKPSKYVINILIAVAFLVFLIHHFVSPRPTPYSGIVWAATPTPSPPTLTDSPDPQAGSSAVTFSFTCSDAGYNVEGYACKASDCSSCLSGTTTNCWCASAAAASNPTCTYTCPSCTVSTNTYYGNCRSTAGQYTLITSAQTFACLKENGCTCTGNSDCYGNICDTSGTTCCISCNVQLQNTACGTGNGNCEAACGAPAACDEQAAGTVLAQCNGAGQTYYADKCGSGTSCTLADDTSKCISSGTGCTASSSCNNNAPNYCPSAGTWCSDGTYGTTCTAYDKDKSSTACTATGSGCTAYTWFSTYTANDTAIAPCCGDDGTDVFENAGAGNSACANGASVAHDGVDSSQRYHVFNGIIYYCMDVSKTGSGYTFVINVNSGTTVGSYTCKQSGQWVTGQVSLIRGGRIRIS